MSEMVERVSRAIMHEWAEILREGREPALGKNDRRVARAAIAAMRGCTPAMEAAFVEATLNIWATPEGLRKGYAAMIDAALSEGADK